MQYGIAGAAMQTESKGMNHAYVEQSNTLPKPTSETVIYKAIQAAGNQIDRLENIRNRLALLKDRSFGASPQAAQDSVEQPAAPGAVHHLMMASQRVDYLIADITELVEMAERIV